MIKHRDHEHAASSVTDEAQPHHEHSRRTAVAALRSMLRHGMPSPAHVAELMRTHPDERGAMLALLHRSVGNRYVRHVMHHLHAHHAHATPDVETQPAEHASESVASAPAASVEAPVSTAPAAAASEVATPAATPTAEVTATSATATPAAAATPVFATHSEDIAEPFRQAMTAQPAADQQVLNDAMNRALDYTAMYQNMSRDYAIDYLQRTITACLNRGTSAAELAQLIGTMGFAQGIASGYERAYYEAREKADPEFARQQQAMRAGNQAQTRVLADQLATKP